MKQTKPNRRGFSLIELVIVVVIIAIIAAIAVPRMSRGSTGANEAALMQNLAQMRTAIELFAAEHLVQPSPTPSVLLQQLTWYSKADGSTSQTKDAAFPYGPYLQSIPPQSIGQYKGSATIVTTAGGSMPGGWYWDGSSIFYNGADSEKDAKGNSYNKY